MSKQIDPYQDIIDIRLDIIERYEELENNLQPYLDACEQTPRDIGYAQDLLDWKAENGDELDTLKALLEELEGNGGDEHWRGGRYPSTLIRDSYFNDYMDEMVADCYSEIMNDKNRPFWMTITLDYRAPQMDYSSIEFHGITYWYR